MEKGVVTDYESYVTYCDEMSVLPMTRASYLAELALLQPPPANPPPPSTLSPSEGPAAEEPGLVATVWFAGVKDEVPTTSSATVTKPKKKQKESLPETKE
jgi:hypothetical protein